jgi:predicted dithiol-disulfide oxidoreductase (DUF899 family)
MNPQKVVSSQEWILARQALLEKEKELTRLRDDLSRQRRELPWERVEKPYIFDGPDGRESLADLFAGRGQLVVYHFMFGPDWPEGCPSCSMVADHIAGSVVHLAQRDVTLVAVSRARLSEIEPFRRRMGWGFKWVSSYENDFNRDFRVSFTPEEMAQGKVHYNYGLNPSPRIRAARSITPTPRTRAASSRCSGFTTFSISRPRAAMRTACRSPWRGSAITTATSPPPRRPPAARGRRRRERAPLLRNDHGDRHPGRDPGATAQVPGLHRGLAGGGRDRRWGLDRRGFAHRAAGFVRRLHHLCGGQVPADRLAAAGALRIESPRPAARTGAFLRHRFTGNTAPRRQGTGVP